MAPQLTLVDSYQRLKRSQSSYLLYQKTEPKKKHKRYFNGSLILLTYNFGLVGASLTGQRKVRSFTEALGKNLTRVDVAVLTELKKLRNPNVFPKRFYQQIFIGRHKKRFGGLSIFVRRSLFCASSFRIGVSECASTLEIFIIYKGRRMVISGFYILYVHCSFDMQQKILTDAVLSNKDYPIVFLGDANVSES